jgi:hypothetical protein
MLYIGTDHNKIQYFSQDFLQRNNILDFLKCFSVDTVTVDRDEVVAV